MVRQQFVLTTVFTYPFQTLLILIYGFQAMKLPQ